MVTNIEKWLLDRDQRVVRARTSEKRKKVEPEPCDMCHRRVVLNHLGICPGCDAKLDVVTDKILEVLN